MLYRPVQSNHIVGFGPQKTRSGCIRPTTISTEGGSTLFPRCSCCFSGGLLFMARNLGAPIFVQNILKIKQHLNKQINYNTMPNLKL